MPPTIIKRDGRRQLFDAKKLSLRIYSVLSQKYYDDIDVNRIVTSVSRGIPQVITAEKLDGLLAEKTAELAFIHPSYDIVAGKLELAILARTTPATFSNACNLLGSGPNPILSPQFMKDVTAIGQYLDHVVRMSCSFPYTYSAVKTMEQTYLLKKDGKVAERPTYMYMRVALHLHGQNVEEVTETYEHLLHHAYIHATPTMANAGTIRGQLSSCYLMALDAPYSTEGLYRALAHAANISTSSGGIGINFNACPSVGANIDGNISLGLPPVLRLFESSLAVNVNGQNRRPAAITAFLEVWHADLLAVINMRRNRSNNNAHLRNVFQALWVADLFMKRVHHDGIWTFFSPHDVPQLNGCFGETFEARYMAYETDPKIDKVKVSARSVMRAITQVQAETGGPFMMYKDSINLKNNQSNLGVISHSNLCTEIVQYSSPSETAVCNLASIILPSYVRNGTFAYEELHSVVQTVTYNLNRVIDRTICPSEASIRGNRNQRAIGIGIQGLADTFIALAIPYDSRRARTMNFQILETIYHAALTASVEFARLHGCYPTYAGSPLSQGYFQFDLWGQKPSAGRYDWDTLRAAAEKYGAANSLLVALMPTSGTSQLTGCTEAFEPLQSNIFTRHVLSGEYRVLSPALVRTLSDEKLWSEDLRIKLIQEQGSVQNIAEIPERIKALFRTAWEIGPRPVVEMAVERAPFVCQSQSLSICMSDPTPTELISMHFYAWRSGLKTGIYYLRTRPAAIPIQLSIPVSSPTSSSSNSSVAHEELVSSSSSSSLRLDQLGLSQGDDHDTQNCTDGHGHPTNQSNERIAEEVTVPNMELSQYDLAGLFTPSSIQSDDAEFAGDPHVMEHVEQIYYPPAVGTAPSCEACGA